MDPRRQMWTHESSTWAMIGGGWGGGWKGGKARGRRAAPDGAENKDHVSCYGRTTVRGPAPGHRAQGARPSARARTRAHGKNARAQRGVERAQGAPPRARPPSGSPLYKPSARPRTFNADRCHGAGLGFSGLSPYAVLRPALFPSPAETGTGTLMERTA